MIKIKIDWATFYSIIDPIIISLILRKAYKGQCLWLKDHGETDYSFEEYKSKMLEYWKIILGFKIYIHKHKMCDFKNTPLHPTRLWLLKYYFKSVFKQWLGRLKEPV